jgi:hypothetical protein
MPAAPVASREAKNTRVSHYRYAEHAGIPCAMVLRPIARSPRSTGLDSLRRPHAVPTRKDRHRCLANLIPASGDRDHTPSPSARGPARHARPPASIASRTTCRDDRDTPSREVRDGADTTSDFNSEKAKYFHARGLTRFLKIRCRANQSIAALPAPFGHTPPRDLYHIHQKRIPSCCQRGWRQA